MVFYEAPHRVEEVLEDMQNVFGDREACIARELTKLHEECLFGKLSEIRPRVKPLGEFVIVVGGNTGDDQPAMQAPLTREAVLKTLGISRNDLYDLFFKKKADPG
jgi:16S rRNA (cytidine1402-2'-O)-methyltransferase